MSPRRINTIFASREKLQEQSKIETALGSAVICDRCGATLATYHDACRAGLDDPCPGFQAIERAAT